ncbi:hypothetical protein VIBNISOn1_p0214 [Vibrio nigripulchritudo SOn1]|uniref:Transposase n=1 Tax=Vibrio nigripulchritudo SOn1 TaxID=1238450 RepID=A0AAV2W022_9VIBR|nr:hypothetical protein VIBNISOn1_p0214 [Vibrio nigripulchritudo SOn1]
MEMDGKTSSYQAKRLGKAQILHEYKWWLISWLAENRGHGLLLQLGLNSENAD